MNREDLELLAPAGSLKTLKAVVHAGADAVYFGGQQFGARAYANNFTEEEVLEAIDFGHLHDSRIILAVNTLLKEEELEQQLYEYLRPYYEAGLDAVIVQDLGVMQFIRRHFPSLPVHTSTQMTVCNVEGARLLADYGASRVVMARELSLKEIKAIHEAVPVEIEGFVHGALCYCYSGQCLLSSMIGGRSGNRGRCAQPCRLPYEISRDGSVVSRKNQEFPLSPKDLCTIDFIPQLAESGVYSFKIEGRMKQTEYAAGVVSIYRKYMDRYLEYGKEGYRVSPKDQQMLLDFGNRSGFTDGYLEKFHGRDMITFSKPNHAKAGEELGRQVKEQFVDQEIKEKIKGNIRILKDIPMEFEVQWKKLRVKAEGQIPLPAQKQPLTEEKLLERMKKTGGTGFEFEELAVTLDDGLFLPVQAQNELRRMALEQLVEVKTSGLKRNDTQPYTAPEELQLEQPQVEQPKVKQSQTEQSQMEQSAEADDRSEESVHRVYTASVETADQLKRVLAKDWISIVYLDSIFFGAQDAVEEGKMWMQKIHNAGKQAWLILPAIFRNRTRETLDRWMREVEPDGYLVKNLDELGYLKEYGIPAHKLRIDHSLYTYSNRSQKAFEELGVIQNTIPLELNRKEMRRRCNENSELLVYGYLPLMTTAQCLNDNLCGCDHRQHALSMKDRYGISFPVKNNCSACYNTVYNSKAMSLLSVFDELEKLKVRQYRLAFTVEDSEETKKVLAACEAAEHKNPSYVRELLQDITYGHYKRGVE